MSVNTTIHFQGHRIKRGVGGGGGFGCVCLNLNGEQINGFCVCV